MVNYTTPVTATFELQRQSLKQGQQAVEQIVDFQQDIGETVIDGIESQESTQRQVVDLQQVAVNAALDAVEATVPGSEQIVENTGETVDEQYEGLLTNQQDIFEAIVVGLDDGCASYDDLTAAYVEALNEQIALLLEANEELEEQSVEVINEREAQIEEFQDATDQAVEG